jgi:hypothetical protein
VLSETNRQSFDDGIVSYFSTNVSPKVRGGGVRLFPFREEDFFRDRSMKDIIFHDSRPIVSLSSFFLFSSAKLAVNRRRKSRPI